MTQRSQLLPIPRKTSLKNHVGPQRQTVTNLLDQESMYKMAMNQQKCLLLTI